MRKPLTIIAFFVLAAFFWWLYESTRPIPGLEPKGGPEGWMPWVSLVASVVSLLTGVVTLALKLIELRQSKPRRKKASSRA